MKTALSTTQPRRVSGARVVVPSAPRCIRLSPCSCTARAAKALETAGVNPTAALAMVTAFPLKEDVAAMDKKLDDLIQLSRDMAVETQQIRRDMTRLVIGLAFLSNATVLVAAILSATLAASSDSLVWRLLPL